MMEAKYLVLDKDSLRVALTRSELEILSVIVKKITQLEGRKLYKIEEIK